MHLSNVKPVTTNPTRPGLSTVGTAHEIVPMVCSWVGVHVSPGQSRTRTRRCQSSCLGLRDQVVRGLPEQVGLDLSSITLPSLITPKLKVVELASGKCSHPRPPMWHDSVGFSWIGPIVVHPELHARLIDAHCFSNQREAALLPRTVRDPIRCKHGSARGTM